MGDGAQACVGKTTGTIRQVEEGVSEMLKDRRTGRTWDGLGVAGSRG